MALWIETTINDAHDLSVYRTKESDPEGEKSWHRLRKGMVDLPRRAEISQAANGRSLTLLAAVDSVTPLGEAADCLSSSLSPWSAMIHHRFGFPPFLLPRASVIQTTRPVAVQCRDLNFSEGYFTTRQAENRTSVIDHLSACRRIEGMEGI